MIRTPDSLSRPGLVELFSAFVTERYPFAARLATEVLAAVAREAGGEGDLERLRPILKRALAERLAENLESSVLGDLPETTPGVSAGERHAAAIAELVEACDGFLERRAIALSLTRGEKREMLRGILLTRAVDNRLKTLFSGSEVRYGPAPFQGKGFRSLGQEAIYAAPLRLRRGPSFRDEGGEWRGDVVAPLIRDAGAALAMRPEPEMVRSMLNAQMGKAGPPMEGRDLHLGDFSWGVLPPAAPLSISALTVAGLALAMQREGGGRVAVSFIGEGGTSLGEWHEAINLCAARRLPAVFCVQNNQTALSTRVGEQSAVRVFADKAAGYGVPGITLDGTDPEALAAAFAWAAERARRGLGPALIELVAMRMCGHAHHDDMLYLGRETAPGWEYPSLSAGGYADPEAWELWKTRDPVVSYAARLRAEGVIEAGEVADWRKETTDLVETEARAVIEAPWPEPASAGTGVYRRGPAVLWSEPLEDRPRHRGLPPGLPEIEPALPFSPRGRTLLEAVMLGVGDALAADPRVFVYGEDVGPPYGNAFLLLRPLLAEYGERILNSPIAEGGVLGVCVGAALGGLRPIGEIQFNDFVATGLNQLVNNAAKIHYRWGEAVPMVVRMPWGGLRSAGPYHSQNTEPWFYRTPGLKIVAPSTPEDARGLMRAAVEDPDPVLYYEHIALYRNPRIKQALPGDAPPPIPLGRAALRRAGSDLAIVSYGAYVHEALGAAEKLAADGIEAAVLDLRSLVPLDRAMLFQVARHCGKVLIVQEDTRTGSIGESLAALLQEELFEDLDAPVRVLGSLDTPVPYSPPLEQHFLPGAERVERAARLLAAY